MEYRVGDRMEQHCIGVVRFVKEFIAKVAIDISRRAEYLDCLDEVMDAWDADPG